MDTTHHTFTTSLASGLLATHTANDFPSQCTT